MRSGSSSLLAFTPYALTRASNLPGDPGDTAPTETSTHGNRRIAGVSLSSPWSSSLPSGHQPPPIDRSYRIVSCLGPVQEAAAAAVSGEVG